LQSSPRWIFFIEPFLLFIAFILQLLISLSIPIIKPIDLFSLHIKTSAVVANTGEIRFGLWGLCFLNVYDTGPWDYGVCTAPHVGYDIDPTIVSIIGLSPYLYNVISKALTSFLIVHPLVACMTFISMVPGFMPFWNPLRVSSLALNVVSAVLSTLVAGVDLAMGIVAQQKLATALAEEGGVLSTLGLQFYIAFGVAPFMGVAAVLVLWAAVIVGSILLCDCCFGRIKWSFQVFEPVEQGEAEFVPITDGEKAEARWYACCYGWRQGKRRKPRHKRTRVEPPATDEKKGWLLRKG